MRITITEINQAILQVSILAPKISTVSHQLAMLTGATNVKTDTSRKITPPPVSPVKSSKTARSARTLPVVEPATGAITQNSQPLRATEVDASHVTRLPS